ITGYIAAGELARQAVQWKDLPQAAALLAEGSAFRKALERPKMLWLLDAQTALGGRKPDHVTVRALCDRFNIMASRDLRVLVSEGRIYIYSDGYIRRELAGIDKAFDNAMEVTSLEIDEILKFCLSARDGVVPPAKAPESASIRRLRKNADRLVQKEAIRTVLDRPIDALPSEAEVKDFLASGQTRAAVTKTIYIPTNRDPEVLLETLITFYDSIRLYRWSGITVKILDNKEWGAAAEDRRDYQAVLDRFCRQEGVDPQALRIEYVGPKTLRTKLAAIETRLTQAGRAEVAADFHQVFLGDTVTRGAIRDAAQLLQGDNPYLFNDDDVQWRAMMPERRAMSQKNVFFDVIIGRVATMGYAHLSPRQARKHHIFVIPDILGGAGQVGLPIELIPRQEAEPQFWINSDPGKAFVGSWRPINTGGFVDHETLFVQIKETGDTNIARVNKLDLVQQNPAVLNFRGYGADSCFAMDPRYNAQAPVNLNLRYFEDGPGELIQLFFPRQLPGPRREAFSSAFFHNRNPSGRSPSDENAWAHIYLLRTHGRIFIDLSRLDWERNDCLRWEPDAFRRKAL
ncbi:MAG: hypothetical protein WCG06_06275, partial [Candidatus Omnitrophota bacterium]